MGTSFKKLFGIILALLVLTFSTLGATPARADIDTTNLVGYWRLDGSPSPSIGPSGVLTGGSWSTSRAPTGTVNTGSLSLSGADGEGIEMPLTTTATHNISMSAWTNWSGINDGTNQFIAYNGNSGNSGYGIMIASNGHLGILIGGQIFLESTFTLSTGTWQHVFAIRDATDTWKLYVDGTPVSIPASTQQPNTPAGQTNIGRTAVSITNTETFNGLIDDVRIYTRVLSQDEMTLPTVTGFAASSPATGEIIPISTFTASDANGIAGYLITELDSVPAVDAAGWAGTAPATYTVSRTGSHTLYPWAKDAAGNVSVLYGSPVVVTVSCLNTATVITTSDSGGKSLREALSDVCPGGTIIFHPSLSGATIRLASTLTVTKNVTIDASSLASPVNISGDTDGNGTGNVRVFRVNSGVTANLIGLTITKGYNSAGAGGISNVGTLTLRNSTLSDNAATTGAGAIANGPTATLTVINSTFLGNGTGTSAGQGGAIQNYSSATIVNSTFFNNSSYQGGAIYSGSTGTLHITNSTFSENSAGAGGAGNSIYNAGTLNYANTILANPAGSTDNCFSSGTIGTNTNNLVEGDTGCGTPSLTADPDLGDLASNGGRTETMALQTGSVAINTGDYDTCVAAVGAPDYGAGGLDQRGVARPQPAGGSCDIGAYEVDATAPTITSFTATSPLTVLDIPITAFTATDNVGVSGYMITESSTPPAAGAEGWTGTAPTSYTVSGVGSYTLYPWAKDAIGNVSAVYGSPAAVTISCLNAITVTNTNDSGAGSLRQAIAETCSGGTITFAPALSGQTIRLTSATLTLSRNVTIDGSALASQVTISGDANNSGVADPGDVQVFFVNSGVTADLNSLTIVKGYGSYGGGLHNEGTTTITNCRVNNNSSSVHGGGLVNMNEGSLTVSGCTISDNILSGDGAGGAILNYGNLNVTDTTISGNTPGIYTQSTAAVVIRNTTFSNNGMWALQNWQGNLVVVNSTFDSNTGLGALASGGDASMTGVTSSTFSGNTNGIAHHTAAGTFLLVNSVVANSTSGANCSGTIINSGNNIDSGTTCGFGSANGSKSSTNPLLGALGNYGGPTQTLPLLPGSPAIDAGNSTACADATLVNHMDQRGITRPSSCDIGAFESRGFTRGTLSGTPQSATINTGFATPLGLTVTANAAEPVAGGKVTFTPPGSGASAALTGSPATIASGGAVSVTATANGLAGGPYNVTASAAGASDVTFALTNTQGTATVTFDDLSQTYAGAPQPVTVTTNPAGLTVSITYNGSSTPPTNAGDYAVVATVTDPNYNGTASGTYTIEKAPLTVTAANKSKTYGDANPAFTVNYSVFVSGETPGVLGGSLSFTTAATPSSNVGDYAVTPSGLTSSNYTITFVAGTLTVNPAALTVTADDKSKTYGAANPSFTANYSSFVLGQDPSVLGGSLSLTTPATPSSGVGDYAITPSGLTSTNYAITFAEGTLTINPVALTVTADDKSKTYGAANPSFTVHYSGFVLGQTPSVLGGSLSFTTPATTSSDVGNYPITPLGLTSSNYAITFVDGTLTITEANTATTLASSANPSTYGGSVTFTATVSPAAAGGTVNFKSDNVTIAGCGAQVLTGSQATCTTSAFGAGTHVITAEYIGDTNHNASSGTLSPNQQVNKAAATVTPGNLTHEYDGTAKSATATTNPVGLTVAFTYNGSSTPPSAVGTYALVATVDDPNYQGTANATFIIQDTTAPTVNTFTATSPSPSLNIPITSFTASDTHGIAGYLITQSATPPLAGAAGWSGTVPTTYTVTGIGSYTLYPWVKDAAGNVSAVFATPVTVVVNSVPPSVTMTSAVPDPTNASPIAVTVQFSKIVTGFETIDISAGNASVSGFTVVDGDTYTFNLVPSGHGLVTADIAGGVAQDSGGNGNTAAVQFSRTFDNVAPYVASIVRVGSEITSADVVEFTVTFSEPVLGVDANDFSPDATGHITGATINGVVPVNASTYTVTVGTGTYNGTLGLNVKLGASIADAAGNSPSGLPYTAGQTYTINKAVGSGTYDDADGYWTYSGSWTTYSGAGPFDNTNHYSNVVGSDAQLTFNGNRFILTYVKASNRGTIAVYVDGTQVGTINARSTTTVWRQTWSSPVLTPGVHTVRVVHAGGGTYIDVDAIEIFGLPSTVGAGTYDDAEDAWAFSSGWTTYSGAGPFDNTNHYSNVVGSDAQLTFNGNRFILTYAKASNRGTIAVYVDGTQVGTINARSTTTVWRQTWSSPVLTPGVHTVRVVHAGGGTYIDVDAIEILASSDLTAPAAISDLEGVAGTTAGSVDLTWTAPGDDGVTGTATGYLVRYSTSAITADNWASATPATTGIPIPAGAGAAEHMTVAGLTPGASYYFAVRAQDEVGNLGDISNSPSAEAQSIAAAPAGIYDDTDANWLYTGSWTSYTGTGPYNGTSHYSNSSGSEAQITINGAKFAFTYVKASSRGTIAVYVDGTPVGTINAKSTTTAWQQTWLSPTLTPGVHVVRFVHAGGGTYIDVDKIQVFAPLGAGDYDDTDANWMYGGTWNAYSGTGPLNDTSHYTSTVGADAQLVIDGSGFTLTYVSASNRGSIDVYVDGVKVGTINAKGTSTVWQQTWTLNTLTPGVHTIRFVHAGSGTYIDVDAITVLP